MKKFLMTGFISHLLILIIISTTCATENCINCHKDTLSLTTHKNTECIDCHPKNDNHYDLAADFATKAKGCLSCHKEYTNILNSPMHTRINEKNYANRVFERYDKSFFDKNCSGCHISSCTDCHSGNNNYHDISIPKSSSCLKCHNDYYVGADYTGLGIREDHERYQRGIKVNSVFHQKMLPDIHYEKGLECGECHSMSSLSKGERFSKNCIDCHKIDRNILEHSIDAHIDKMECSTCHAAWSAIEYGTFWIKFEGNAKIEYFRWVKSPSNYYRKSSYKRLNTRPHIGINEKGKYAPIRPQFINIFSLIRGNSAIVENKVLSYDYKIYTPHTIRRETRLCNSCHESKNTFLIFDNDTRIFMPEKDGLPFSSFTDGSLATISNGSIVTLEKYKDINKIFIEKRSLQIQKWQQVLEIFEK